MTDVTDLKTKFILDEDMCYRNINITKVIDGDTIVVDINLGMSIVLKDQHIRLYGINAPELKKDVDGQGHEAKYYLTNSLKDVKIKLYTINRFSDGRIEDKKDKYGRLLGIIVDKKNDKNFNLDMLLSNHSKPYFI